VIVHICNPSTQEAKSRVSQVERQLEIRRETLSQKKNKDWIYRKNSGLLIKDISESK
jgi:hypothetical protein